MAAFLTNLRSRFSFPHLDLSWLTPHLEVVRTILLRMWRLARYAAESIRCFISGDDAPAAACLVFRDRKILLVRTIYAPGIWVLPGGRMYETKDGRRFIGSQVLQRTGLDLASLLEVGTLFEEHKRFREKVRVFWGQAVGELALDPSEFLAARWESPGSLPRYTAVRVDKALEAMRRFEHARTTWIRD